MELLSSIQWIKQIPKILRHAQGLYRTYPAILNNLSTCCKVCCLWTNSNSSVGTPNAASTDSINFLQVSFYPLCEDTVSIILLVTSTKGRRRQREWMWTGQSSTSPYDWRYISLLKPQHIKESRRGRLGQYQSSWLLYCHNQIASFCAFLFLEKDNSSLSGFHRFKQPPLILGKQNFDKYVKVWNYIH